MTALLLALTLAAAPTRLEAERAVRDRFEAVGRTAPPVSAALSAAAEALAQRALSHGLEDAAGLLRVTAAVSQHGGWDPNPTVVALRAPTAELLAQLRAQHLATEPVSEVGVGLALGPERAALVLLLARRRVELAPFPRQHAGPVGPQRLCLTLRPPLHDAELFVTRPGGAVERAALRQGPEGRCGALPFETRGRHVVEVLARGPSGPEVAALFFVDVGAVESADEALLPEPATPRAARAELLARINALRLQSGLGAVQPDEALGRVAQAWAERLAAEGFFAHVDPAGGDLRQRLGDAQYAFAAAGENLGLSSGPLAAHFGIEHSPGHRQNLLEPAHQRLGLGLATRPDGLLVLVEVLARPAEPASPGDPLAAAYAAIRAERQRRRLPALRVSPVLEGLAQAHAREALARDLPRATLPGRAPLHERAFGLLDELAQVSVDVTVGDRPLPGLDSRNLAAAANRLVGVGVARGDSPTHGAGRYWVVVIYGATRPR